MNNEEKNEFVNRAYELEQICRLGGPKFILVDAPAGYGKTFLLRKVKETYDVKEDWDSVLVDLRSQPEMSSNQIEQARTAIANEISSGPLSSRIFNG